jgi:hypothetical protein
MQIKSASPEAGPRVQPIGLHEQLGRKPFPGFKGCGRYAFPRTFLFETGAELLPRPRVWGHVAPVESAVACVRRAFADLR